jgi:hypothetical protein
MILPVARRTRTRRTAAAATLLLLSLGPAAAIVAAPGDAERAEFLVLQGRAHLDRPIEARDYARRALEFAEADADALALLGKVEMAEGRSGAAAGVLTRSLDAGGFRVFQEELVRVELASALLHLRHPQEALTALGPLDAGSPAEALVLGSRAERLLGHVTRGQVLARLAARVQPDYAPAYLELAAAERAANRFGEARAALDAGRLRLPADAAILLALVPEERTGSGRVSLLDTYFGLTARPADLDAMAAVLGSRYDPERTALYLDRFLEAGGPAYGSYLAALSTELADDPDLLERLAAALRGWTGARRTDTDGDGVAEYTYRFEQGTLMEWGADLDQDGSEEVHVTVTAGAPGRVQLRDLPEAPDSNLEVVYTGYPWLSSAAYTTATRRRVYDLVPAALRLRVEESATVEPRLPEGFRLPRERDIRAAASGYRDYLPATELVLAHAVLLDEALVRVESDADGDGKVEHVVNYRDGVADRGARDLDGDGVYETQEYYGQSGLERLEVDTNGDGRPDYVRRLGDPGLETWDLDADGVLDVERSAGVLRDLRRMYSEISGRSAR